MVLFFISVWYLEISNLKKLVLLTFVLVFAPYSRTPINRACILMHLRDFFFSMYSMAEECTEIVE